MIRMGRIVCAACLLLAAGCVTGSFLNLNVWSTKGHEQVVLGSPDRVAITAQAALSRMGLFVKASREGEDFRLTSSTASGKHFSLVLKRQAGDSTAVHIEWENDADESFWLDFASQLTREQVSAQK
jgi:hypothetical protein